MWIYPNDVNFTLTIKVTTLADVAICTIGLCVDISERVGAVTVLVTERSKVLSVGVILGIRTRVRSGSFSVPHRCFTGVCFGAGFGG